METTKKKSGNSIIQTNFMLDDVIETLERYGIKNDGSNDELIKALTIQKIEYGRYCLAVMLNNGEQTKSFTEYYQKMDSELCKRIEEVGGKPTHPMFIFSKVSK